MALVKLEIDGKRLVADSGQTILEVARDNGIHTIATLCHDDQLEPFSSCFLCVVKVKGARTLLPACSTKVAAGMVVETHDEQVRKSRKAALELLLSNHYADCVGPCQLACPAGIDIQGYLALAAFGKHKDAIALIKEQNPLPAICGRVCTRPCEVKGCRRNLLDEPVGIDYVKRYLADAGLAADLSPPKREIHKLNRRIAVVGGGPAGLSCAHYLALKGYDIAIFESLPEAGGMLRYGIPEYRLPKEVLDVEISQILELGVTLFPNVTLGKDFTIAGLQKDGYEAIFLAIGAWSSTAMQVQDENTVGVLSGIEFLKTFGLRKRMEMHGTVLVVGGGNTAVDCARTALRVGATEVRLLYRRTQAQMPANPMEIEEAHHEGVHLDFLVAPQKVVAHGGRLKALECIRMELGERDASGRQSPRPLRGSEFLIPCDFVIAAIGQNTTLPDLLGGTVGQFLPFGETLNLTRWKTIAVEQDTFETSVEGVFAGGDVVTGAATAIEAIAAGRKAAHSIDSYLKTGKARPEPTHFNSRKDIYRQVTKEDLRVGSRHARRPMPVLPVGDRLSGFQEVEQGYGPEDVIEEAHRCLECGCTALFDCKLRQYATEYDIDITSFLGTAKEYRIDRSHPLIELDPNKCILCGRCVRICSEVVGVSAYGFINRGFHTTVKPALGQSLLDTDCISCGLCVDTCPTGAIVERIPLAKPGPWNTGSVESICGYCGVGCGLSYDIFHSSLIKVSQTRKANASLQNHCRKGRFGYNYLVDPQRLTRPKIRAGRELQDTSLPDALSYAAIRLKEFSRRLHPSEMAVFVSPRMTNEEMYLTQKFARVVLKTHNVGSFSTLLNEPLACFDVFSTGTYQDLLDAQTIVVVNSNTDEEHPVVDLLIKRAIRKGAHLIYIGPFENRVSHCADVFLPCEDGQQADMLLALKKLTESHPNEKQERSPSSPLETAAALVEKSLLKMIVFNKDYRGLRVPGDERVFATIASHWKCSLLALREKSNAQGLQDMGMDPLWLPGYRSVTNAEAIDELERQWCVVLHDIETPTESLADLLIRQKIRLAVILGEDPLGNPSLPKEIRDGLEAVDFLVVGDLFLSETAACANLLLPLSSHAETSGTMTNSERRVQKLNQAIPPAGGMETWQILQEIAARMGYRFKLKYTTSAEITQEIHRILPMYRSLENGIWDLKALPFPLKPIECTKLSKPISSVDTRSLDVLETRFDQWFSSIFARARETRSS